MEYLIEKKAEVLGATFVKGKPEGEDMGKWRNKLGSREEKLKYLETAERIGTAKT